MLELEMPVMRYDITLPLLEGRVPIEGVDLKPSKRVSSMVTSPESPLRDGSFGLADLNLGYFLPAVEAGWDLIGLPVFSKRKPVFGFLFCRADREIRTPKDLEGKRIGTRQYRTAISVWMRGLLRDRYGVDVSTFEWIVSAPEVFPVHDRAAKISAAPDGGKTPVAALIDGDVDAIITDISDAGLFRALDSSPQVKRLFPDYQAEDLGLYRETGMYTPVHLIVLSKKLNREHPDVALKLYKSFQTAKDLAYDDILSDRGGFSVVYLRERLLEQMRDWGDPWRYGLSANRTTIETFARFNVEQGMTRELLTPADLFATTTLET